MDFAHDGLKYVDHLRSNIKIIYNIAGNTLINQHSDINRTIRILKDESLVRADRDERSFMTASARWSDLILPAASVLESNNVTMGWCNDDYLLSNSRAVEPLFGTMPDYDWVCMIADAMGYGEAFRAGHETTEDWILDLYNTFRETKETELPPYEQFRENGGYKYKTHRFASRTASRSKRVCRSTRHPAKSSSIPCRSTTWETRFRRFPVTRLRPKARTTRCGKNTRCK